MQCNATQACAAKVVSGTVDQMGGTLDDSVVEQVGQSCMPRWVSVDGSMGDDRLSQPSREMKVIFNLKNRTSTSGIRADLLFEPAVGRDHKGRGGTHNRISSLRMAPVHFTEAFHLIRALTRPFRITTVHSGRRTGRRAIRARMSSLDRGGWDGQRVDLIRQGTRLGKILSDR